VLYKRAFTPLEVNCNTTTCGISGDAMGLTPALLDGVTYTWRVQARNPYARANSAWLPFTPDLPGTPTLLSPANLGSTGGDVLFAWQPLSAADRFVLFIANNTGQVVFKAKAAASTLCSGGVCSMRVSDVGVPLPAGAYTWWLKAVRLQPRDVSFSPTWSFAVTAPLPPP
jgi:hypothetical protein